MKKLIIIIVSCIFIFSIMVACDSSKETVLNDDTTKNFDNMMSENSNNLYEYGTYTMIEDGKVKTLSIDLQFKTNDIFRIGTVQAIRNLVIEHLQSKYPADLIKLQIASTKPTDLVDYVYKDGKWDKDVK